MTCTHFALSTSSVRFDEIIYDSVPLSPSQPVGLIFETASESDMALALYKNTLTRDIVVDFYNAITHSDEITRAVLEAAAAHSVTPSLAFALCGVESQFNSRACNINEISVDRGLFQLNSLSFPHLTETDFFSVRKNAEEGMKHLRYCLDRGGNEVVALAMYNAGEGRVSGTGAPKTTLTYISRILNLKSDLESRFRKKVLEKFSS